MTSVSLNKKENTIELSKDFGGLVVTYRFFSMSGDELPVGEPFVDGLSMWRAERNRKKSNK